MGYLLQSATGQMAMLRKRVPIEEVLRQDTLSEEKKVKLRLAEKAKTFAEAELGLKKTGSYRSFVQLDQPFVTYVVSAASQWELKPYLWHFPIVGEVPYKGYFNEKDAIEEDEELKKQGLDTFRRGVSAYSTLGWFDDPVLSSMLEDEAHHLVNTIIHETVHATLYIRSSADFNERLASFLGNMGAELFFLREEGPDSPTVARIRAENADEKLFSTFISKELRDLEDWYKTSPEHNEERRTTRLESIAHHFSEEVLPHLQSDSYRRFANIKLNNARLLLFKTYVADQSDYERVYDKLERNFPLFVKLAQKLEKEEHPEAKLKEWDAKTPEELRAML
ncbi:MAG: aminopeptidase [Bdellovibrio sp.]|nr:MAG: aminopeptidase [Bdellovibrio sp.]